MRKKVMMVLVSKSIFDQKLTFLRKNENYKKMFFDVFLVIYAVSRQLAYLPRTRTLQIFFNFLKNEKHRGLLSENPSK